jgi:hypothetical protein
MHRGSVTPQNHTPRKWTLQGKFIYASSSPYLEGVKKKPGQESFKKVLQSNKIRRRFRETGFAISRNLLRHASRNWFRETGRGTRVISRAKDPLIDTDSPGKISPGGKTKQMIKSLLAFLGGACTIATTAFILGGRPAAVTFVLGIMVALGAVIGATSSVERMRRVSRFLNAVADGIDGHRKAAPERDSSGVKAIPSQAERDVAAGLAQLGMTRKESTTLAQRAAIQFPQATFEDLFRAAVNLRKMAV